MASNISVIKDMRAGIEALAARIDHEATRTDNRVTSQAELEGSHAKRDEASNIIGQTCGLTY